MKRIRNTNVESLVKRYSLVYGETEEEVEMVDFFKQVLAAGSRGVISSFALSIMVSRYWGKRPHEERHFAGYYCQDREALDSVDAP